MQIIKITAKLTSEEKETLLHYDYIDKVWLMDTTIMKFYTKAKKQGWKQLKEYVYDDGSICGGVFEAPERAVTIRNIDAKQMSDKQMCNLLQDEED